MDLIADFGFYFRASRYSTQVHDWDGMGWDGMECSDQEFSVLTREQHVIVIVHKMYYVLVERTCNNE